MLARGGLEVHIPAAAAVAVRASGYPQADDVASTLVDPEDPDEVSAYFESLVS